MTIENLELFANQPDAPANDAWAIVPDDATDLTQMARSIYVGVEGDIALVTRAGSTVTFKAVPAGAILPIRVKRVLATGTTATDMLGLV